MKKSSLLFTLLIALSIISACAQGQKQYNVYAVGFYNLENLFDTCHDAGKNDYQFLPDGSYRWNGLKYTHKLHNMARTLGDMGTDLVKGIGCAAIGVSEVENAKCLTDLCNQEPLRSRGWKFCHIEGPDRRGVDCALLYNPRLFTVRDMKLVPYVPEREKDKDFKTRGFLTVSGTMGGDHVTIVVNHLPSRFSESYYRELGGRQLRRLKDSLIAEDPAVKVIIMGDMNDDPHNASMAKALGARQKINKVEAPGGLYNPWWDVLLSGDGTMQYDGKPNLFDQIIVSYSLLNQKDHKDFSTLKLFKKEIFKRDYLFQKDGKYKGNNLRTHAGGVWLDGFSDHLPTVIYLSKEKPADK